MRPEIRQVLKLVGKKSATFALAGLLLRHPPRHVDEMLGMSDGNGAQPHNLGTWKQRSQF